jgi:hypothetical protein
MSKGIAQILEVFEGLNVVVPAIVEVAADGKIDTKDIVPVIDAVKKYEVVIKALQGLSETLDEAKDLDMIELAQIGTIAMKLLQNSKDAYNKGKAV